MREGVSTYDSHGLIYEIIDSRGILMKIMTCNFKLVKGIGGWGIFCNIYLRQWHVALLNIFSVMVWWLQ